MASLAAVLAASLANATPLMLAALGETLVERTGRVNLGVEGMMAVGAAMGVLAGVETGSPAAALLAGSLAGAVLSLIYAVAVVILGADQIVTGLVTVFAGLGLADLIGLATHGAPAPPLPRVKGSVDAVMALAVALAVVEYYLLYRTWLGVELRALGESEEAAESRGLRVVRLRVAAVVAGGLLAGLAGAYMSEALSYGRWYSGMTAGWGWIAVGLVILGYWHPLGVAAASLFTGALFAARPLLPSLGIPAEIADATPYLAVLAALATAATLAPRLGVTPPASVWRED
ncbi:ABC transporter permease subunit [Stetteria hydrogenophila]